MIIPPVTVTLWCLLQEVLQQQNKLREPLDWFHHQTEEVESVAGRDLLHFQEISEGRLSFGLGLGELHGLVEVVDKVRVHLKHFRFGKTTHEHVPDFLLLKIISVIQHSMVPGATLTLTLSHI